MELESKSFSLLKEEGVDPSELPMDLRLKLRSLKGNLKQAAQNNNPSTLEKVKQTDLSTALLIQKWIDENSEEDKDKSDNPPPSGPDKTDLPPPPPPPSGSGISDRPKSAGSNYLSIFD